MNKVTIEIDDCRQCKDKCHIWFDIIERFEGVHIPIPDDCPELLKQKEFKPIFKDGIIYHNNEKIGWYNQNEGNIKHFSEGNSPEYDGIKHFQD